MKIQYNLKHLFNTFIHPYIHTFLPLPSVCIIVSYVLSVNIYYMYFIKHYVAICHFYFRYLNSPIPDYLLRSTPDLTLAKESSL